MTSRQAEWSGDRLGCDGYDLVDYVATSIGRFHGDYTEEDTTVNCVLLIGPFGD